MRRIHVRQVQVGDLELDATEAHHARDVLRLAAGEKVEIFDDVGQTAAATIIECTPARVIVRIDRIETSPPATFQWIIASAVPKGARADWMIEKLSELGTAAFIPLATQRSVVLPEGKSKLERWKRLAAESAKQSRRRGTMRIGDLTPVDRVIENLAGPAWYLSVGPMAIGVIEAARQLKGSGFGVQGSGSSGVSLNPEPRTLNPPLTLLIGPEGGWTDAEIARFQKAGLTPVTLGGTILRTETAAVVAAGLAAAVVAPLLEPGAS